MRSDDNYENDVYMNVGHVVLISYFPGFIPVDGLFMNVSHVVLVTLYSRFVLVDECRSCSFSHIILLFGLCC